MCGIPGSGKSETSKRLGQKLKINALNPDTFRKKYIYPYVKNRVINGKWQSFHKDNIIDKQWYSCAEKEILNGNSVIMDATFHIYEKRKKLYRLKDKLGCGLLFIHCVCGERTAISRMKKLERLGKKTFRNNINGLVMAYSSTYEEVSKDSEKPSTLEYNTETEKLKKYNIRDSKFIDQIVKILSE